MSWALDNGVVEPVAAWLGTYCLHGVALFALAALVARVVRSARVREQLWRAALFGPLVTASVQLGAGVDPLAGQWLLPAEESGVPTYDSVVATAAPENSHIPSGVMTEEMWLAMASTDRPFGVDAVEGTIGVDSSATRAGAAGSATGRSVWQLTASILLVLGIAALMLRALLEAVRMRRLGDRAAADDPALLSMVEALCARAGMRRRVHVEITGRGVSAYATGVLRPTIVVPSHAFDALDGDSLRAMLAHEIGHLARLDPLWAAAVRSVTSLFFFQPLNWITARKLDECAEFCCDEFAVDATGDEVALARCLATVAEWLVGPGSSPPARPVCTMAHQGSPLAERVERILATDGETTRVSAATRWLGAAAVSATALAAPGFAVATPIAEVDEWPSIAPQPVALELEVVDVPAAPGVFEELTLSTEALRLEIELLLQLCDERDVAPSTVQRLELLQRQCDRLASIATDFQLRAQSRFPGR